MLSKALHLLTLVSIGDLVYCSARNLLLVLLLSRAEVNVLIFTPLNDFVEQRTSKVLGKKCELSTSRIVRVGVSTTQDKGHSHSCS